MSKTKGSHKPSLPEDSWPQQISGPEDVDKLLLHLIDVQQQRVKKAVEDERATGAILDRAVSMELRRLIRQIATYKDQPRPDKDQTASKPLTGQGAVSKILAAVFEDSESEDDDIDDEDEE